MSSYDKYFTEKNKTHMFAMVKDIIIKETAYDISHNSHYHTMFQVHYPHIFKDTEGDTIVDCNRTLIDTLCPLMIAEIRANERKTLPTIPEDASPVLQTKTPPPTTVHIYSSQRTTVSQNRHEYTVNNLEGGEYIFHRITIPEEELSLFGLPTIMVKITTDTTYTLLCDLEDTKFLGDRNYISYLPETSISIPHTGTMHVRILDASGSPCIHGRDIYDCIHFKHIQIEEELYTCLKLLDQRDIRHFQKKDTITIFQGHVPVGNLTVRRCLGDYLLCKHNGTLHIKGEFQILNLSLQNHMAFHSVPRKFNPR